MLLRVMYLSIVCVLCYTHTSLNSNSKSSELKASENKNNIDDDGDDDDVQPHDSWISTEKKDWMFFFYKSLQRKNKWFFSAAQDYSAYYTLWLNWLACRLDQFTCCGNLDWFVFFVNLRIEEFVILLRNRQRWKEVRWNWVLCIELN